MALRTGQLPDPRHFYDQLKQELTVMSRNWTTYCVVALAVSMLSGQNLFAGGLDKEEREEVSKIVSLEIQKAAPGIAQLVIDAMKKSNHKLPAKKPAPKPAQKPGLNDALAELLKEQELCEDREKLAKVIRRLVGTGDSSTDCKAGCYGYSLDCDYKRADGSLDFGKFIDCEIRQQELIEERQKLGKALKRLISDDECKTEGKTTGVSYYSPNYCPPGYAPVVLESATPAYYRYVKCD